MSKHPSRRERLIIKTLVLITRLWFLKVGVFYINENDRPAKERFKEDEAAETADERKKQKKEIEW